MTPPKSISLFKARSFQYFVLSAAILLYLSLVTEEFAQRTGIGRAISGWLLLPAFLLILGAGVSGWIRYRQNFWISRPLLVSIAILIIQGVLLGIRVSTGMSVGILTIYLTSILLVHALVMTASVVAYRQETLKSEDLQYRSPFSRLVLLVFGFSFLTLVSGVIVTLSGVGNACQGWLFCNGFPPSNDMLSWVHLIHRLTVGVTGLLLGYLCLQAWKTKTADTPVLVLATSALMFFIAEGLIGAQLVINAGSVQLVGLHVATGGAVWGSLVLLVVHVGLTRAPEEILSTGAGEGIGGKQRLKSFLTLTKPIIVILLLMTTVTGMVVGAKAWPPISTLLWTLLGGGLAAGGSSAINQYIDRDLDAKMKRTAKRPLASGTLTPAEGLAFGVALCLLAFYILAVFVNLLAALLSVFGMFYYVWLYSLVLKTTSVQNIVIGGGAGAVPPLVGWAAATGTLTFPALLLFVIIFFWTPPHFWALALVRSKDYARGGVPMLPVVRGEKETRKQILIYTFELVGITLLVPLAGIGGSLYFVGAAVLGLGLIYYAVKLRRLYDLKLAWQLYRYSSMYLGLLCIVLIVDALVV